MDGRDWYEWHRRYEQPGSALAARLADVREQVRAGLDAAPAGSLRVVSMVAGQGHDLIPVLAAHPRRDDVTGRLVELDPRNAELARRAVTEHGLRQVEVVVGDAALIDHYTDLAPADLVLACGLFGNISDADVACTVRAIAGLTRRGGTVIWTRHRRAPDLFPQICDWFADQGFAEVWTSAPAAGYGVGAHRAGREPSPVAAGTHLFTFVGAAPEAMA